MARLGPERVKAATAWRFAYLLIQGGLSTAVFVGLAQVLPSDAFAAAAVAQGILVISQAVGDFGLSQAAVTSLPSRIAAEPELRPHLLAGAARGFIYASGVAIALALLAVPIVPVAAAGPVAAIAPGAGASVIVAGADGLLRSEGHFRQPVLLVLWSRLGMFAAIPAAALTDSAVWACGLLAGGACLGALPALLAILRTTRSSDRPLVRPSLEAALPLGVAQILIAATGRLNTVAVSVLTGLSAAAAFESTWRLFQLGQYIAGGVATALAPFVGVAFGGGSSSEFLGLVRRGMATLAACGFLWAAGLVMLRYPLARLFGGELDQVVADAIVPLAIVIPVSFVGFLGMMTLAASQNERVWIVYAHIAGAVLNAAVIAINGAEPSASDAALGAAAGVAITSLLMMYRVIVLTRNVDSRSV